MKKVIKEKIFSKHYEGIINGIKFSDFPKDLLPTDIIDIEKEEGYYSENNSYDDYTALVVYREREETNEEYNKRVEKEKFDKEFRRKHRYERYLELKKEFENENQSS